MSQKNIYDVFTILGFREFLFNIYDFWWFWRPRVENCQIFPFQTVKIFIFKLSKFSFLNCQKISFSKLSKFTFQTVKISLFKLSKFPFSNCQNSLKSSAWYSTQKDIFYYFYYYLIILIILHPKHLLIQLNYMIHFSVFI